MADILTEKEALHLLKELQEKRPHLKSLQHDIEYLLSYEKTLEGKMALLFGMISRRNLSMKEKNNELEDILRKINKEKK